MDRYVHVKIIKNAILFSISINVPVFNNNRNNCDVFHQTFNVTANKVKYVFYHFSVTDNCTSDKHRRRKQAMMFITVILGVLAMLQFSVYFLLT